MKPDKVTTFLKIAVVASFLASFTFGAHGVLDLDFSRSDIGEMLMVFLAYWLFMLPFVLVAGIVVALPISKAMVRMNIRGIIAYALIGLVAGAAVSTAILGGIAISRSTNVILWAASIGVLPGLAAGVIWWIKVDRFNDDPQLSKGRS